MTTPNQCQFWDCDEILRRRNHFLCAAHYSGYELETIDQCPSCNKYKQVEYDLCLNCHRQAQAAGAGASARPAAPPPGNAQDGALLAELHSLRRTIAQRNGLPDFMVFSNATLEQMAAMRPANPEAMLSISGVGPAKLEQYGQDFLRVLRKPASAGPGNRQPPPRHDTTERDNRHIPADKGNAGRSSSAAQIAENPPADDPRQRYRAEYRTSDGHYVRSRAEAMIDDWLYRHNIVHAYERKLPVAEDALSDFYLPQGNVYIEFWGKDDSAYARRMQEKQEIYRRNNLPLISLTDAELYSLDDHMPRLLRKHGVSVR